MLQLLLVAFLFLFFISFHRFLLFVLAGLGALLQLSICLMAERFI